jgi:hypothetical protein
MAAQTMEIDGNLYVELPNGDWFQIYTLEQLRQQVGELTPSQLSGFDPAQIDPDLVIDCLGSNRYGTAIKNSNLMRKTLKACLGEENMRVFCSPSGLKAKLASMDSPEIGLVREELTRIYWTFCYADHIADEMREQAQVLGGCAA